MLATATYEALLSSIQTLTHPCMPAQHRRRALRGAHASFGTPHSIAAAALWRHVVLQSPPGTLWHVGPARACLSCAAPLRRTGCSECTPLAVRQTRALRTPGGACAERLLTAFFVRSATRPRRAPRAAL